MTHQDIANYLRIAPETISRTFRVLEKKNLIKIIRKKVFIHNIDGLKHVAEFELDSAGPTNKDIPKLATENLDFDFDEEGLLESC